jgi:hypothetical protein
MLDIALNRKQRLRRSRPQSIECRSQQSSGATDQATRDLTRMSSVVQPRPSPKPAVHVRATRGKWESEKEDQRLNHNEREDIYIYIYI